MLLANNNSLDHDNSALDLLKHENGRLMKLIISQDLVHTTVNSLVLIHDYNSMQQSFMDEYNETLMLKELIVYVSATCLSSKHVSDKLVVVTPMNKTRRVRIISTKVVPSRKSNSTTIVKQTQPSSNISGKLKDITNVGLSSKSKTVGSKISNHSKPMQNWGSNVSTALSSSRVNLRSYKSYSASKTKSWLWHRRLSHLNFNTLNQLAKQGLVREAVSTTRYTQNRSLIRLRYNKTPYELMHEKKPDLSFLHVFGSLCYPTNGSEDLGKLKLKADIGIFVGYAPAKKAFRIYNKRIRKIMETIHVTFYELTTMAFEQFSSRPTPQLMTPTTLSLGLVPNLIPQPPYVPPTKMIGISCSNRCLMSSSILLPVLFLQFLLLILQDMLIQPIHLCQLQLTKIHHLQFWSTAMAKTINEEVQIHARVDGKEIVITELFVRRDLQLADKEGIDCLPNSTIFEQLALMGKPKRKDTQVPQTSGPTDNAAEKTVHKELGDSLVRASTTASSLEA
nr:retrovirus-related Pol polyprotein from transposon TNT 1-94 [Tanacetum cinerariifolium]